MYNVKTITPTIIKKYNTVNTFSRLALTTSGTHFFLCFLFGLGAKNLSLRRHVKIPNPTATSPPPSSTVRHLSCVRSPCSCILDVRLLKFAVTIRLPMHKRTITPPQNIERIFITPTPCRKYASMYSQRTENTNHLMRIETLILSIFII